MFRRYCSLAEELAGVAPSALDDDERLVFFLNVYHALWCAAQLLAPCAHWSRLIAGCARLDLALRSP